MTIKEIEQVTGLNRSVIRYYEKEKLIDPIRNAANGYRDYSQEDVVNIQKIAYLRTLGISIEDIRRLSNNEADLYEIVKKQKRHWNNKCPIWKMQKGCAIIRRVLRPFVRQWLIRNIIDNEAVTDYIVNYLCMVVLIGLMFMAIRKNNIFH